MQTAFGCPNRGARNRLAAMIHLLSPRAVAAMNHLLSPRAVAAMNHLLSPRAVAAPTAPTAWPPPWRRLPGNLRRRLAAKGAAGTGAQHGTPLPGPGHQGTYRDTHSRPGTAPWPDRGPRPTLASAARPGCGGHRGEQRGEASHPVPPAGNAPPTPTDPLWVGDAWARNAAARRAARPPAPPPCRRGSPHHPALPGGPGPRRRQRGPRAPPPPRQQTNRSTPSPPRRPRPGRGEGQPPPDGPLPLPRAKRAANARAPAATRGHTTYSSRVRSRGTQTARTRPGRPTRLPRQCFGQACSSCGAAASRS